MSGGNRHLATVVFALLSCGSDSKSPPAKFTLEGSLGQVMNVGYDETRILLAPEDVSLLFVRVRPLGSGTEQSDAGNAEPMMQGTSEDYPLQIAYRLLGEPMPIGMNVDLAALDGDGQPRGVFSRKVKDDPRTTLPSLVRGEVRFESALEPDAVVRGDFHLTFENGIEAASGRTVFSSFSARVQP